MEAAQEERKTVHEHEIRLMEQDLVEMKGVVKTMGERLGRLENTNTGLFAVKHFVTATIAVVGSIIGTTAALWGDEVKYMEMLLYEGGALSLTRVLVVAGWLAFLAVSLYLVWHGASWQNYETFASLTAGGGAATQIANKFINSKYNSALGSYREDGGERK